MTKLKKEKVKKERKPIPQWLAVVLTVLIVGAILGGICVGAYFVIKKITLKWFVFWFILFAMAPATFYCLRKVVKQNKLDKKQLVNAVKNSATYILFYWLCDFFYLTFLQENLTWRFILGGLIMVIIFYNLAKAFVNGNHTFKWGLLQDFLVGIALTIYLIYIIPCEQLQNVVIPIVAGVYGGLLTLVGVAWTIRQNAQQKREDELQCAIPLFTFATFTEKNPQANGRRICLVGDNGAKINCYALLENSDKSSFYITRFFYENSWHKAEANNVVLAGGNLLVHLKKTNYIEHPIMEIEDVYGIKYYYDLMFCPMQNDFESYVGYYTLAELKQMTIDEVNEVQTNISEVNK